MKKPNHTIRVWTFLSLLAVLAFGVTTLTQTAAQDSNSGAAPAETTQADGDAPEAKADENETADSATEPDSADATTADETIEIPEITVVDDNAAVSSQPAWITAVDDFFGKWLVAPAVATLFFDFGTGKLLGEKKSIPFVVVWLFVGSLFLTIRMGFINVRGFWHAVRLTRGDYDNPDDVGEVSHFQALASALSATVGLGNIAGVALAIGTGGPGATLWMIVVGLIGMTAKFTECTLGQMYRKVDKEGIVLGGPMQYLKDGLADMQLPGMGMVLSTVFALLCVGASLGGGNAFQIVQSLGAIQEEPALSFLKDYPWIYGLVMATLAGAVIIGGIRSIGAVAGKIVPFMCGAYVVTSLYVLLSNYDQIPAAVSSIISGAFSPGAALGGVIGVLVIGIQRAVFSNEAGTGSAAIAHSAAKTDEPVSEGIVALLEPFIDTVVVCTMTALVIVITGVANDPQNAALIDSSQGAALTSQAFQTGGFAWFRWILYAAVILFAFSTLVSWSYYGERCFVHLFGKRSSIVYKIVFLIFTVLGSIVTARNILAFSDILILGLALPNMLGLYILSGKVRRGLDSYMSRLEKGEFDQ